jgi:hypothetical protein
MFYSESEVLYFCEACKGYWPITTVSYDFITKKKIIPGKLVCGNLYCQIPIKNSIKNSK